MTQPSDPELLDRWRSGDVKAGDQLVLRYFDELKNFFINSVGDQDCADVLQDTFRRMLSSVDGFRGTANFRTYLYSIAKNARADYFRQKYRGPDEFDANVHSVADIEALTPSEAVAMLEQGRRLNDCIRKLPIEDREILELYYWHGWRAAEIARLQQVNDATIRTRIYRSRKRLRICLDLGESNEAGHGLDDKIRQLGRELGIGP